MPFAKPTKSTPSLNRSMMSVLNTTYQTRNAAARMWSTAPSCMLFQKKVIRKPGQVAAKGKKLSKYRGNRAMSTHTIKALASGAAANAGALAHQEAMALRCDVDAENAKYPLLPCVTRSAAALFEQAYIAYNQTMFGDAVMIKDCFPNKHKKVTVRCAVAAANALNQRVAAATGFMPTSIALPPSLLPAPQKRPKKAAPAAAEA